jgi:hypothetical protein
LDLYCPSCGEPWDHDTIHEVANENYLNDGNPPYYLSEEDRRAFRKNPDYREDEYGIYFRDAQRDFQARGCVALGGECGEPSTGTDAVFGLTRQDAAAALYDVLGDDTDGAAAMLEDMGF